MIIIAIGGAENGYLFFGRRIIERNATKSYDQINKKTIWKIFHQKKSQKVLVNIDEIVDIFLNSANF